MPFQLILMPIMSKMPLLQALTVAFLAYGQLQAWVAKASCLIFWQFQAWALRNSVAYKKNVYDTGHRRVPVFIFA